MSIVERRQRGDDRGGAAPEASGDQPPTWTRVKALFLEALEQPESERHAFVARIADGDNHLRSEVDSLLASAEAADSFCETPAAYLLHTSEPAAEPAVRLQPGARLGVYEISDFVAAGGMGAVYRARHTLLARQVAIKTVVGEFADAAARRRLIREARHASLLSHPNICAVHDVGEVEGTPFIVMEYVAGKSLGALIREAVPPRVDALRFGIQIASALDHAHRHGIIHRDLKSSNVMVDETGNAIVLDFGLARRLPESGVRSVSTATGGEAFAGTLSHMAPEVLRGEPADARSDVWALGVLLYELLTGELPFSGRTPFETSSAILGESPRPISVSVPLALRLILERCLVKNPQSRYQRAQAVAESLDAVRRRRPWPLVGRLLVSVRRRTLYGAGAAALLLLALFLGGRNILSSLGRTPTPRISTVALLPIENATGDSASAFYADGIGDALGTQLGAIGDIRVLSGASVKRVAATARMPIEIGRRLAANVIVQGALRRANDSIAIDITLVRPSDGRVLWSAEHQSSVRDVLALEAQIVRALADSLRLTAAPGARERLATVRAVSPDVYEAYLMGRYEWAKRTPASLERAVAQFTRATELDPTYAPPHAALADCFNQLGTVMLGTGSPIHYRPRAIAEAIKALQLDPNAAEAHAALGYALHYDLRWAEAEQEFRRAIALNPSYSLAHIWYANLLMSRLRMKEATAQVYAARDLDPYSLIINTNIGWVLNAAGRHDAAIAQYRQVLALDSDYVQARWRLASALMDVGRFPDAREQADRVIVLTDSSPSVLAMRASMDGRAGRLDAARALLEKLLIRSRHEYVPAGPIALAFEALGENDSALVWIDKAMAERSNAVAYLAVDYRNTPLERDPRFQAVLRRVGLR